MGMGKKRIVYKNVINRDTNIFVPTTAVHQLSEVCWKKCITGKISSGSMDRTEEACTQNCVDRWMDANFQVLKHLEQMRGQ
jgi:hypothetical protein